MSYGAEINAQNNLGYTVSHDISLVYCIWPGLNYISFLQALALAVQHGTPEAVIKLLQLGADKTLKANTGKCPADLAAILEKKEVQFFADAFKKFRVYSENSTFSQSLNMMSPFSTQMSLRDHKADKENHPLPTCFHRWARFWPLHSPSRPFRLSVPWRTHFLSSSWPMGKHHLPRNGEINWMLKISEKKVCLLVYLIKLVLNSPRANSPYKTSKHNYLSAQHLVSGEMGTFTYFKIPEWTSSYSSGNQKYKYVSSLERTASPVGYNISSIMVPTHLQDGLSPQWCCVASRWRVWIPAEPSSVCEFAGAPSMSSSVSSHSLKTSVRGCWRPPGLCFIDYSADPSNYSPKRDGEANLNSISQFRMLWLSIIHWKLAFYPWFAVENSIKRLCSSDVQKDGVLIQCVCDGSRY